MPQPSAKYDLLQIRLGRDLAAYVNAARGDGHAWQEIAYDLRSVTGVSVSHESLRTWFAAEREAVA